MSRIDIELAPDLDLRPRYSLLVGDGLIGQRVRLRSKQTLGDWLLDKTAGLPWHDWLTTKPFPVDAAVGILRQDIESVPGVVRVASLTVSVSGSVATISGQVQTESGLMPLEVSVSGGGAVASFASAPWVFAGSAL